MNSSSFWLDNPNVLIESLNIWPTLYMGFNEKLNAITRLVILISIIGYISTHNDKIVLSAIITIGIIIFIKYNHKNNNNSIKNEGFTSQELYNSTKNSFTNPTTQNPAMNVMLSDIYETPKRHEAAPINVPSVVSSINESTKDFIEINSEQPGIKEKLFRDVGDNIEFEQSMRSWYVMPSSTIPNDQKSFQEFCYGGMTSCRDITNNETACTRQLSSRWVL